MNDGNSTEDLRNNRKADKIAFERFINDEDETMEPPLADEPEDMDEAWDDNLLTVPEKIQTALKRQMALYKRKSEILARLMDEASALKKKRKIMKAAKKKAVEVNCSKKVKALINTDLAFVREAQRKCDEMIVHERTEIEKVGAVITTLKSLL